MHPTPSNSVLPIIYEISRQQTYSILVDIIMQLPQEHLECHTMLVLNNNYRQRWYRLTFLHKVCGIILPANPLVLAVAVHVVLPSCAVTRIRCTFL